MLEKFKRHPLTFGPTPIETLDRLGKHLGGKVEIYAKREDCNSGLAFGGASSNTLSPTLSRQMPIPLFPSAVCSPTTRGWSPRSPPRSA